MSAKFNLEKIGNFFLLVMKEKIVNPFFSAMWAFPLVPSEDGAQGKPTSARLVRPSAARHNSGDVEPIEFI